MILIVLLSMFFLLSIYILIHIFFHIWWIIKNVKYIISSYIFYHLFYRQEYTSVKKAIFENIHYWYIAWYIFMFTVYTTLISFSLTVYWFGGFALNIAKMAHDTNINLLKIYEKGFLNILLRTEIFIQFVTHYIYPSRYHSVFFSNFTPFLLLFFTVDYSNSLFIYYNNNNHQRQR